MQLICQYGVDQSDQAKGVVRATHEDGQPIDMSAYPGCVLVPYGKPMETLGKFGPAPQKLGEAPTAIDPTTGQVYRDRRIVPDDDRPPAAPALTPDVLTAYAASARYAKEIAGIIVDGIPVATDRASQAAVEKLASRAARDPKYAPPFKGSDGVYYAVDAAKLIAIADAVSDHVDALRKAEEQIATDIASGKVKTLSAVDAVIGGAG